LENKPLLIEKKNKLVNCLEKKIQKSEKVSRCDIRKPTPLYFLSTTEKIE